MKIAVVGIGYVGLSIGILLSQKNEVVALDIMPEKVKKINQKKSPIKDKEIEEYLSTKKLNLRATLDYKDAFEGAEYIIISTPTNYDDKLKHFDTSSIEETIEKIISMHIETTIVIKSTVPIGYTEQIKKKYKISNIVFSPEFLREGKALYDNLYPSRIIVSNENEKTIKFGQLLKQASLKKDVEVKYMNSTEAEATKLFSNTYLAMRVSFFNEIDTYAELKGLDTKKIIEGVSADPRIGNFYNNPSFGYGGYCLPKDTKQLLVNYEDIPQNLIESIIKSNDTRKEHIVDMVMKHKPKTIGIYRLSMKKDSDNFRTSAMLEIIEKLKNNKTHVIIYEPNSPKEQFKKCEIKNDFEEFAKKSDIILANRIDNNLNKYMYKVYTRDLYERD